MNLNKNFSDFAAYVGYLSGEPMAFILSCFFIVVWMIAGPIFSFSDSWQLIVNTATNILTLLMVFLIQNTQSRNEEALQIKLDELIRTQRGAHDAVMDIENLSQEQLKALKERYEKLAQSSRKGLAKGLKDTSTKDINEGQKHRHKLKKQKKKGS